MSPVPPCFSPYAHTAQAGAGWFGGDRGCPGQGRRAGGAPAGRATGRAWRTWLSGPPEHQDICKTFPGPAAPCTAPCAYSCFGTGVNCESRWPVLRMPRTLFQSSGLSASPQVHEPRGQRMAQQALEGNSFSWQKLSRCPLFSSSGWGLSWECWHFCSVQKETPDDRDIRENKVPVLSFISSSVKAWQSASLFSEVGVGAVVPGCGLSGSTCSTFFHVAAGDWVLGPHPPLVLAVTGETEETRVLANKGVALGGMLGTLGQGDCLGSGRVPPSRCAR